MMQVLQLYHGLAYNSKQACLNRLDCVKQSTQYMDMDIFKCVLLLYTM